jgi:hypothetical protein
MSAAGVLLVVPTHDHASTLGLAVRSALEQTVTDLDVVIIGDGVGDDTRDVVRELVAADDRVRFLDRPKSPSRAEATRHEVITSSDAPMVTYLGDDDLLLADHVETMRALLDEHDFAHPFPVVIDDEGRPLALPTDLRDPRCVEWHRHTGHNTVSLTGAAHTMALYRRSPGWRTPPAGRWSDHYMWQQLFALPDVRAVTSPRATTIKPPVTLHTSLDPVTRGEALQRWWDRMHEPGFRQWWDAEVLDAVRRSAVETFMGQHALSGKVDELNGVVDALEARVSALTELGEAANERIDELEAESAESRDEADAARSHLEQMQATRTWRVHDRLTALPLARRLLARQPE